MAGRPLLIFPRPEVGPKLPRNSGRGKLARPGRDAQASRLAPAFGRLQEAMDRRAAELVAASTSVVPEKVLVFETAGPVDRFWNAASKIAGLDWLIDREFIQEQGDGFEDAGRPEKEISGRAYLVMTDARALQEVRSLWTRYEQDGTFDKGTTPWRELFDLLRDVRPWGVRDRLEETGILELWSAGDPDPTELTRFEIELWYREAAAARNAAERRVATLLADSGGRVVHRCEIAGIRYHALLVELPQGSVQSFLDAVESGDDAGPLLLAEDAIMFIRPRGQIVAGHDSDPPDSVIVELGDVSPLRLEEAEPVIAMLDGLPVENHPKLAGRIVVDDPDGWAAGTPVDHRRHGTEMASVIAHGDLGTPGGAPLRKPVYVRPVLKPRADAQGDEYTPDDVLLVDLIHVAVRRIVAGSHGASAVAPTVRVINLSLGDSARLFDGAFPSPWARLLDWMAWEHGLLFVVSAGNHLDPIDLPEFDRVDLVDDALRVSGVTRRMKELHLRRRLRVPGESINALTVGWANQDASNDPALPDLMDLVGTSGLAHPASAQGLGIRRAVKPDLLAPGGRCYYMRRPGTGPTILDRRPEPLRGPGIEVARVRTASLGRDTGFTHGTSPAAALVTRAAGQLHDVLEALQSEPGGDLMDDRFAAVLLKAMLVHGADWRDGAAAVVQRLELGNDQQAKDEIARLLGYGHLDVDRVIECTERRATLLGWGELADGESNRFAVPLPAGLASVRGLRRVVLTLAWLSPIEPAQQRYRSAFLWITPPAEKSSENLLHTKRKQVSWQTTRRGTVQHEILEGEAAAPFADGDELLIPISCVADAGKLPKPIPYGLAVTLEVGDDVDVRVYEEVRAAIRAKVRSRV